MSERRAAIIFLVSRARSRSLAHRARARHPAPRRAKKSTGAGRVPARGEANSFSAGMANLAVRGCASRFFVLAARYFRLADRSTRWAEAGPAIFVFLASVLLQAVGQLGHRRLARGVVSAGALDVGNEAVEHRGCKRFFTESYHK